MFDPQEDPLGLALKQRAREQRMAGWAASPSMAPLHSALGDDWDAFFQANEDAAGGLPVKFAGGAAPAPLTEAPGEGATLQDMENWRTMHSNQLRGLPATRASIRAMKR